MPTGRRSGLRRGCGGYTYLLLLFAVAVSGILLAVTGQFWHTNLQREKEADLLFAGRQIRAAIESYYRGPSQEGASPIHEYPRQLEQLLEDRRTALGLAPAMRHLRRLYVEPFTASQKWGLIRQGEGIVGVYSLSEEKPLKTNGFVSGEEDFGQAKDYRDWRFIAKPDLSINPGATGGTANPANPGVAAGTSTTATGAASSVGAASPFGAEPK